MESKNFSSIGNRPREKDIIVKYGEGINVESHCINSLGVFHAGHIKAIANNAGKGFDDMHDIAIVF